MIFDSMDAQTFKGKPITGTPVGGSVPVFDGTRWILGGQVEGQIIHLFDDFFCGSASGFLDSGRVGQLGWLFGGVGTPTVGVGSSGGIGEVVASATGSVGDRSILSLASAVGDPFDVSGTPFGHSFDMVVRCDFSQCSHTANHYHWLGLLDFAQTPIIGSTGNTPALCRGVGIYKAAASSNWVAASNDGSTENSTSLGALSAAWRCMRIRKIAAGQVRFSTAATLAGLAAATETVVTAHAHQTLAPAFIIGNAAGSSGPAISIDMFSLLMWDLGGFR